jgi:RimJ/RimL family protein N-acetyltransferase
MVGNENNHLDIFIEGELVDLCIPTSKFAYESNWYAWFNNKDIVKYLEQGLYPNTRDSQKKYFEDLRSERLTLIIVDKKNRPIGVISLSFIDFNKKNCDISLVVSNDGSLREKPLLSLEAMALMTAHAFESLGMKRVNAGQHIELKGWQNRLELIGYKLEGLHIDKFVKGDQIADSMSIAVLYTDYRKIKLHRGGRLFDSVVLMNDRIKSLPPKALIFELKNFYENNRKDYYDKIFFL